MSYDDEKIKRSAYTKTDNSTKRNYISSGNFKKSTSFQVFHNANIRPDYAIGGEIICNLNGYEALELKNKIIAEAKEAYAKHTKQKFQAKSYEWSLVVNIKPETTLQDLEKLASHFFEKYGFQCYQVAIHRDEGHINEQGEKVINHHAHMEFITLDKQTGKNNYRRELITPKVLREIQTEIAEILEMQRGQDKRLSGRQRIEPRKYAQMKEAEKRERKELTLPLKEIKAVLEDFRKQSIGKGYPKEFFKELSDLKQNTKEATLKDLKNILEDLAKGYESQKSEKELLKQELEKLRSEKNALESDLKQKEQKNDKTQGQENKNDLRGNSVRLNTINEKELKEINEKIAKLKQKPKLLALEVIELENLKQRKNQLSSIDKPQEKKSILEILDKCLMPHERVGKDMLEKLLIVLERKDNQIKSLEESNIYKKDIIAKLQRQQKPTQSTSQQKTNEPNKDFGYSR